MRGVDAVVHAASRAGQDVAQARTLLYALHGEGAGAPHLVFVSIVGADRVPLGYYRDKVRVEEMIADAGVRWTVLRATQFHDLLATVFGVLGRAPVLPVLAGAGSSPSTCATSPTASSNSPQAARSRTPSSSVAPRSGRWPTSLRPGRRRAAAGGPCCPAGWPRRCVPVACSPAHADGRITFEEFSAARPRP